MDIHYPRPQLIRRSWLSLEGDWSFSFNPTFYPQQVSWDGQIRVPFPPESPLSGVNDCNYHDVIWYQRRLELPSAWAGQRIWLHFGAVDYSAQVWVNGHLVAEHEGGHTPFSTDITPALVSGPQTITVRAADAPDDLDKPRGKQDWELEPHSIWYPRTTGIWQPVWLEPVGPAAVSRLRLTPDVQTMGFHTEVALTGDSSSDLSVEVRLSLDENTLAEASWPVQRGQAGGMLSLPHPRSAAARQALLWSPENPVLFDLTIRVRQGEQVLDEVQSYAGLRSVEACDGQVYLNGEPYFLQLILDQGYWQESLLAAPSAEALRQDVELTKAMGFNGVRKHQKIEDPRYLYWADRLGLLVWDELPSAYRFSPQTARRATQEFLAMIERDYNHPCVIAWVPFNESWGIPEIKRVPEQRHLARSLYYMAKAIDPTRLVVDNDGWEHVVTDLFTIHDYVNDPQVYRARYDDPAGLAEALKGEVVKSYPLVLEDCPTCVPVILSEFGGIRMGPKQAKGWGYTQVETPEEFLKLFEPVMLAAYGRTLSGYCYTQLTDTFQEQNGLLTMDRKPKLPVETIRAILERGLATAQGARTATVR